MAETDVKTIPQNPFVFHAGYKPIALSINESLSENTLIVEGVDMDAWWNEPNAPASDLTKSSIRISLKNIEGLETSIGLDASTFIEVVKAGLISLNIMSIQD